MKNRTIIGIVCMILAVAMTFAVAPLVNRLTSDTTTVVRLKQEVGRGAKITAEQVETVKVKTDTMPQGVYVNTADVVGKYASSTLYAGDILTKAKLTKDANSADDVFATLDGSKVAVSVTIDTFAAGLSGKLQNGDIISLIVVDKNAGTSSIPGELKYMKVITTTTAGGIDQDSIVKNEDGSFEIPSTITVLCNTEQAKLLAKYFEKEILIPKTGDELDCYREEYNNILLDKASNANGIIQEKYLTVSIVKKDIEEARTYFARIASDLRAHFSALGSKCEELDATEKLRLLHDFYRAGEEESFHFELSDMMKKGHDFKDYICPDSMERADDYVKLGEKYVRVLFLKDYASYIKDSMVSELTELNRNMMLSIDIVPIPMDEAVREVENRLLGVETNISATRS